MLISRSNNIIQHKKLSLKHCRKSQKRPKTRKLQNNGIWKRRIGRLVIHTTDYQVLTKQMIRSMQATRIQYKKDSVSILILSVQKLKCMWKSSSCSPLCPSHDPRAQNHASISVGWSSPISGGDLSAELWDNLVSQTVLLCVSTGWKLLLEVGAEVSDLGLSHREIGVPHTGWILQREEVKTEISTYNHSLNTCSWRGFVHGVLV